LPGGACSSLRTLAITPSEPSARALCQTLGATAGPSIFASRLEGSQAESILALGVAVWSLMTAISGLARSFVELALARIGVGVEEATGTPCTYSLVSDYFPQERRARAFAILVMGSSAGIAVGNLAGGFADESYGWRSAFWLLGLPGLAVAALEPRHGSQAIRWALLALAAVNLCLRAQHARRAHAARGSAREAGGVISQRLRPNARCSESSGRTRSGWARQASTRTAVPSSARSECSRSES
jgi:MFS family permease